MPIKACSAASAHNNTEDRLCFGTCALPLLGQAQEITSCDGVYVLEEVRATLKQMEKFFWLWPTATSGEWKRP